MWGGEREHTGVENSHLSLPSEHLAALRRECCSPKTYISLGPEAGVAHTSGPFSQVQVLSLKISRTSSSLAGGPTLVAGSPRLHCVCHQTLCCVCVGSCFCWRYSRETSIPQDWKGPGLRLWGHCLILFPQKLVWEGRKCLFYSSGCSP